MREPYVHPSLPPAPIPEEDEANRLFASEMRPDGWMNPVPASRYNLVVIGGGAAGVAAARCARRLGARVALVERSYLGGTSLAVGSIPSKALCRSARLCADIRRAATFGVRGNLELPRFEADFPVVMERIRKIRARLGRRNCAAELKAAGIDVFFGAAAFADERTVTVGDRRLRFSRALIATGARPRILEVPGLQEAGYLTNESIFNLTELPRRLMVIGGGPLGCEFGQSFQRLGSQVTIVQKKPLFLQHEERDAAQLLSESFGRDGMQIRLDAHILKVSSRGAEKIVELRVDDSTETVTVDQILTGVGRSPNVEELSLERAGISHDSQRGVKVDDFLQTTNPRVYAAGDVCSRFRFTQSADAAARIAVMNSLFLARRRFSSLVIPWCTFTDPEVAHVGVYVRDARAAGIPIKSYTIPMHEVDRAILDGEELGFVKVHIREGTDQILGGTIVGSHAGEMINEISLAMVSGLGLRALEKVIHSYPTQAEGIKMAADAYARRNISPGRVRLGSLWLWLQRRWAL